MLVRMLDNTKPSQWMYVNSKLNPTDHASRGMNADTFIKCQDWIGGPDFLKKDKKHWPVSPVVKKIQKDDVEVKAAVSVNATDAYENTLNKLICHYSEWHRLTRAISWMIKLKRLLHKLSTHRKLLTSQASERLSHEREPRLMQTRCKGSKLKSVDCSLLKILHWEKLKLSSCVKGKASVMN